jgi:hypothetical protein
MWSLMTVMVTTELPWAPVAEHAVERITQVADRVWQGESVRLIAHVPSVTSYVARIRVGDRDLYAKYSLLGVSLASVLRGRHGGWPAVLDAQRRYLARAGGVVQREADQLRRFTAHGPLRVCPVAACGGGVLFTEACHGVALDRLLVSAPQRATGLLRQAWRPITMLRTESPGEWPVMPERDIAATFDRKFAAAPFPTDEIRRDVNPAALDQMRLVVNRLREHRFTCAGRVLVFGEVKPEHVIMTGGGPRYVDPGVHQAAPAAELAKFVSRCLLLVTAHAPSAAARRDILAGLTRLIADEGAATRGLMALLARDTVNILSTYLTVPGSFPLPGTAAAILERIGVVVSLLDHATERLCRDADPWDVWDLAVAEVVSA